MRNRRRCGVWVTAAAIAVLACTTQAGVTSAPNEPAVAARATDVASLTTPPLVRHARSQVGKTLHYDPAYTTLAYPGGDVPIERGVCTDVVIRALRPLGLDLQKAVHEDMRAHFAAYPKHWGLKRPDRNIDHRRVPNLQRWFERQRWSQPVTKTASDYRAGDLVTWMLPGNLPHIGIVSDRRTGTRPLIIHNIGRGAKEEDVLFAWPVTGHYRKP